MRVALLVLLCSGCSAHYAMVAEPVRVLSDDGKQDEALAALNRLDDGGLDALLVLLDRGSVLHRAGRYEESAQALNAAAQLADDRETVRMSEELFGKAPWRMGTLDRQSLHVLNALNYLMLGKYDDAAVEARLTDSEQLKSHYEQQARKNFEKNLVLYSFDDDVRGYLERLTIGRYLSGLAHELAGNPEDAFLDYYAAYALTTRAPNGAPTSVRSLGPVLLRLAREQNRPQLEELERVFGPSAPQAGGEVVVVVEAGRVPGANGSRTDLGEYRVSRPWDRGNARVLVSGSELPTETVTSLENLALRRGALGVLVDTERPASIGANVALLASFLTVPPVGFGLLLHRAWESGVRLAQSWLLLPAEFQVARFNLPEGEHTVEVRSPRGATQHRLSVLGKKPSLVLTRTAEAPDVPFIRQMQATSQAIQQNQRTR